MQPPLQILAQHRFFVMEGAGIIKKRRTTRPLKVTLADGWQVVSTHMCDINIDGLPFFLMGHIIPDLSIASLFKIQVLTEVGCNVTFDKHKCTVRYNGMIILSEDMDPSMDLWTLPLGSVETIAIKGNKDPRNNMQSNAITKLVNALRPGNKFPIQQASERQPRVQQEQTQKPLTIHPPRVQIYTPPRVRFDLRANEEQPFDANTPPQLIVESSAAKSKHISNNLNLCQSSRNQRLLCQSQ
jgi:hypothetical protein